MLFFYYESVQNAWQALTFTFCSLVGLWADAKLSRATEGVAGTVTVALAGLHADARVGVGRVGYRVRWATALE